MDQIKNIVSSTDNTPYSPENAVEVKDSNNKNIKGNNKQADDLDGKTQKLPYKNQKKVESDTKSNEKANKNLEEEFDEKFLSDNDGPVVVTTKDIDPGDPRIWFENMVPKRWRTEALRDVVKLRPRDVHRTKGKQPRPARLNKKTFSTETEFNSLTRKQIETFLKYWAKLPTVTKKRMGRMYKNLTALSKRSMPTHVSAPNKTVAAAQRAVQTEHETQICLQPKPSAASTPLSASSSLTTSIANERSASTGERQRWQEVLATKLHTELYGGDTEYAAANKFSGTLDRQISASDGGSEAGINDEEAYYSDTTYTGKKRHIPPTTNAGHFKRRIQLHAMEVLLRIKQDNETKLETEKIELQHKIKRLEMKIEVLEMKLQQETNLREMELMLQNMTNEQRKAWIEHMMQKLRSKL